MDGLINAPATSLSTIQEVLNQSLTIMCTLKLTSITCVFDKAIYCNVLCNKKRVSRYAAESWRKMVYITRAHHTNFRRAGTASLNTANELITRLLCGRTLFRTIKYQVQLVKVGLCLELNSALLFNPKDCNVHNCIVHDL